MAAVGELVFALGRGEDGVRWSEAAFDKAWALAEYRVACKECAGVAAHNLTLMGAAMAAGKGDQEARWWTRGVGSENARRRRLGERVGAEYGFRAMEVEAVRAVRDAEVVRPHGCGRSG